MDAIFTPLTQTGSDSATSLTSASVTVPTTKKLFAICATNGNTIGVPTYNGTPMSLVNEWTNSGVSTPRTAIYWADGTGAPAAVSYTAGGTGRMALKLVSVEEFDTGSPLYSSDKYGAAGASSATYSVTVPAGHMLFTVVNAWDALSYSATSGTILFTDTTSTLGGAQLRVAGQTTSGAGASVTHSGNWSSSTQYSGVAVIIKSRVPSPVTLTTPATTQNGQDVSVTATATSSFALASNTVSFAPQPSGTLIGPYSMNKTGSGPYSLSVSVAGVPPGDYKAQVQAINTDGGADTELSATFTIAALGGSSTASSSGVPPAITSPSSASAFTGSLFSFTPAATGSTPITWGATGLPGWLTLNTSTGNVSGTPPSSGSYGWTYSASNGNAPNASQVFSLTASTISGVVSVSPASTEKAMTGETIQYSATVNGVGVTPTWSVVAGSGSISAGGLLTVGSASGKITVQATYSGLTGTATVDLVTKDMDDNSVKSLKYRNGVLSGTITFSSGTGRVQIDATWDNGLQTSSRTFGPGASVPVYWALGVTNSRVDWDITGLPAT